jgi:hypothetical protein
MQNEHSTDSKPMPPFLRTILLTLDDSIIRHLPDVDMEQKKHGAEEKDVKELLDKAPDLLRQVDTCGFVRDNRREYPTFAESEIVLGPRLGIGGFSIVFELGSLNLLTESEGAKNSNESLEHSAADDAHDEHYDVNHARQHMQQHIRRNGEARYAVKCLRKNSNALEQTQGMIGMALEAKFLSALRHPNIGK